jgi:hypothetical protein
MSKPNYLAEHLSDPKNWDNPTLAQKLPDENRLRFKYAIMPATWSKLAEAIRGPNLAGVTWFPDANVAFLEATTPIWDAFRVAASNDPNGSVILSGVAEGEMQEWLAKPYHHPDRAHAIQEALDNQTWIRRFVFDPTHPVATATFAYAHLLGYRRFLARPGHDGTSLVGTDPANKVATMNAVRSQVGPRAQGLAKKGRIDYENNRKANVGDEVHCALANAFGLLNRRPVAILTADDDFREIFYKAQWFLDTHYRAWLVGQLIKAGQYGEPIRDMNDTGGLFKGPLTLYGRRSVEMTEVLPLTAESVLVRLAYLAPDSMLHTMSCRFDVSMLEMIETRSRTHGRCTEDFGEANIHIDLGPLKSRLDANYLGVGCDMLHPITTNGIKSTVARLDVEHAIASNERMIMAASSAKFR